MRKIVSCITLVEPKRSINLLRSYGEKGVGVVKMRESHGEDASQTVLVGENSLK